MYVYVENEALDFDALVGPSAPLRKLCPLRPALYNSHDCRANLPLF
jgi:hypothetical protein